jgi:hypothetical protein
VSKTTYGVLDAVACDERTCALRAPTVFSARMKSVSARKSRLLIKTRTVQGFYTRSPIACGCAFHPHAIGDPRGRFFVRAKLQFGSNEGTI